MFGENKEIAKAVFANPCQLIDFNDISDDELRQEAFDSLMIFAMKKVALENLHQCAEKLAILMNSYLPQETESPGEYQRTVLHFLLTKKQSRGSAKLFAEELAKQLDSNVRGDVMTGWEQMAIEYK